MFASKIVAMALVLMILECDNEDALKCWKKKDKDQDAERETCSEDRPKNLNEKLHQGISEYFQKNFAENFRKDLPENVTENVLDNLYMFKPMCMLKKVDGKVDASECSSPILCKAVRYPISKNCSKFSDKRKITQGKDKGKDSEGCCCNTDYCNGGNGAPFGQPVAWILPMVVILVVIRAN